MQWSFKATGTSWRIDIADDVDAARADGLLKRIRARIEEFEATYSRFRADSIVGAIAREAGDYALPADARPMLALYRELYDVTDGLMTPLVGQVLSDAGYDSAYSLQPKARIAPARDWDDAMAYEPPTLHVKKPVQLDFGAVGKGYIIDIVSDMIRVAGIDRVLGRCRRRHCDAHASADRPRKS
jgi:thiamine biosynthesis lipoprotein